MSNATEITNPIDPIKEFQDSIADTIRSKMGELMPDAMIKQIIERAIHTELYEPIPTMNTAWNAEKTKPWLTTIIQDTIGKEVKLFVTQILENEQQTIKNLIAEKIKEDLPSMIATVMTGLLQGNAHALAMSIDAALRNSTNRY